MIEYYIELNPINKNKNKNLLKYHNVPSFSMIFDLFKKFLTSSFLNPSSGKILNKEAHTDFF
jgi:hypothetical protein